MKEAERETERRRWQGSRRFIASPIYKWPQDRVGSRRRMGTRRYWFLVTESEDIASRCTLGQHRRKTGCWKLRIAKWAHWDVLTLGPPCVTAADSAESTRLGNWDYALHEALKNQGRLSTSKLVGRGSKLAKWTVEEHVIAMGTHWYSPKVTCQSVQ